MDRSPGVVELELEGRGRVSYKLILTIPFDSTRKRMSVIVQAPDGSYVLYCKVCGMGYVRGVLFLCVQVLVVVAAVAVASDIVVGGVVEMVVVVVVMLELGRWWC